MFRFHVLAAAAGVLALVASASSVQAKAGAKEHGLHGIITKIEKDADKDSGTITVKTGGKKDKKTGVETPVVEKTIKVTDATTFEKVSHKEGAAKGDKTALETTPAKFGQLKDGDHVSIEVTDGTAVAVKFHGKHHHKKKAA